MASSICPHVSRRWCEEFGVRDRQRRRPHVPWIDASRHNSRGGFHLRTRPSRLPASGGRVVSPQAVRTTSWFELVATTLRDTPELPFPYNFALSSCPMGYCRISARTRTSTCVRPGACYTVQRLPGCSGQITFRLQECLPRSGCPTIRESWRAEFLS